MKYILAFFITFNIFAFCKCPKNLDPVCANGQTFGNACMARCEGNSEFQKGACKVIKDKLKKEKTSPKKPAVCVCPLHWMPVCGVDGKTYGNSCNANCEKVAIKHKGACEKIETH